MRLSVTAFLFGAWFVVVGGLLALGRFASSREAYWAREAFDARVKARAMVDAAFAHEREWVLLERNLAEVERALPEQTEMIDSERKEMRAYRGELVEIVARQPTVAKRGWMRGYGVALHVAAQRRYMAALRRKEDCERWIERAREALKEERA